MSRRPLNFGEKFLFIGSGFLCLTTVGISWFYNYQNELPPLPKAQRKIPNPNAFDVIISAVKIAPVRRSPVYKGASCTSSNIDREFACEPTNQPTPYSDAYNRAFPLTGKTTYLNKARPALIQWRRALSIPFYEPQKKNEILSRIWGRKWRLDEAVRTLARAEWQSNRTDQALEWSLLWHQHVCRYTTNFYDGKSQSSGIFNLNSSIKKREFILDELELLAPHLNSKQMRYAALGLQRNRTLLPSRQEALLASKNQRMELALRVCKRNDLRTIYDKKHPERVIMERSRLLLFRWINKKAGLERIEKQWQWVLNQEKQGLPLMSELMPTSLKMDSNDPFSEFEIYGEAYSDRQNLAIETREVIFISAMGARAFAMEKGRNPQNLKELVPRYLTKTEFDPYNPTQSLVYSPRPKPYVAYNTGKPIDTLPLPKNTIAPGYYPLPPPPTQNLGVPTGPYEKLPTGFVLISRKETLPFLLYSVGPNKRDESGIKVTFADFEKSIQGRPPTGPYDSPIDDVLARVELFRPE